MGRRSLYDSLKLREDFEEIKKRVVLSDDPVKYLSTAFNTSLSCARKCYFLLSGKDAVGVTKCSDDAIADAVLLRVDKKLTGKDLSTRDFYDLCNEVEKLSLAIHKSIFEKLHGSAPTTKNKLLIFHGIKRIMYLKYYKNIHCLAETIPESVVELTEKAVKDCLSA